MQLCQTFHTIKYGEYQIPRKLWGVWNVWKYPYEVANTSAMIYEIN